MARKKITGNEARAKMWGLLDKVQMGDRIYEFAQDIFQDSISVIEASNKVEDDTLDQNEEWYDEIQEEFYQAVYDKIIKFMEEGE